MFLGGNSPERKISLRSGRAVCQALVNAGFRVKRLDPGRTDRKKILATPMDVAFIALHGEGGEDGTLQTWMDRHGLSYTGSDPLGCRLSYDKILSKRIFQKKGIPTPDYCVVTDRDWKTKLGSFPTPFFLKPPRDGSSIGILKVEDFSKEIPKIAKAVRKYKQLLAEKRIQGREFTVGIFGGKALPVIELRPKSDFYDYKSKYTKGMTEYLVPAPIPAKLAKKLQRVGLAVHRALQLRDFSRIDIMVDKNGKPYVLEANAIPGFTALSLLPKAARQAGISFEELCSRLVRWAYERAQKRGPRNGKKKS
ncbi:MAG TPA: D-alanine--D-alanine ligase [Verrucomicrobiae bacterium]|nr:D-alanine--D-alanine ligase [Verrucomicrobiae bacterium]